VPTWTLQLVENYNFAPSFPVAGSMQLKSWMIMENLTCALYLQV